MFPLKGIVAASALGFCVAATAVSAQDTGGMAPAPATSSMGHMDSGTHGKTHHKMNGSMHKMPATVTSVDTGTGIVEVTAGGMPLKVHFPAASVANLKTGDKITLHMGFSKP
jgi:hypothetical protein